MNKLKSVPCMDCISAGRDGIWPLECMEFDHVPERGLKVAQVKNLLRDEEKFCVEVAKCDVICANCHAIRTKKRGPSEESRLKMSAAAKVAWANPVSRANKMIAASRGATIMHARRRDGLP